MVRRALERVPRGAHGGESYDLVALRDAAFQAALEAYEPVIRPLDASAALFVSHDRDPRAVPHVTQKWRELLPRESPIIEVPGYHLGILREPGVHQIARELAPMLAQLDGLDART